MVHWTTHLQYLCEMQNHQNQISSDVNAILKAKMRVLSLGLSGFGFSLGLTVCLCPYACISKRVSSQNTASSQPDAAV